MRNASTDGTERGHVNTRHEHAPEIKGAALWHPSKNPDTPRDVVAFARDRRWFRCTGCTHEWNASLGSVNGCPACANQVATESNSLAALHPDLAAEWHSTRNEAGPESVVPGSNKKVWWTCGTCSEEWQAVVTHRVQGTWNCMACRPVGTSEPEIRLRHELEALFAPHSEGRVHVAGGRRREVDIALEHAGRSIAVEYDGSYWHRKTQERDETKTALLAEMGWSVIRVRIAPLAELSEDDVVVFRNTPIHRIALQVAERIADLTGIEASCLEEYRVSDRPLAAECAEREMARLRGEAALRAA